MKGGKDILKKFGKKRILAEICVVGKKQGVSLVLDCKTR